jgi:hypothetical protein
LCSAKERKENKKYSNGLLLQYRLYLRKICGVASDLCTVSVFVIVDLKTEFDTQSAVGVILYEISAGSLKRFLNYAHQVES